MTTIDRNEFDAIEVGDGETVTIKHMMGAEDWAYVSKQPVSGVGNTVALDTGKLNPAILAIFERNIKTWTIKAPDGSVPPVTVEWIRKLPADVRNKIFHEIERRNPSMSID